jgi:hypothetical protein
LRPLLNGVQTQEELDKVIADLNNLRYVDFNLFHVYLSLSSCALLGAHEKKHRVKVISGILLCATRKAAHKPLVSQVQLKVDLKEEVQTESEEGVMIWMLRNVPGSVELTHVGSVSSEVIIVQIVPTSYH